MNAQEEALLLTMEAVGIVEINHVMLDEALIRFAMYQQLNGPMRYTSAGPIELNRELVEQYIGLSAQMAHHLTKAEFNQKLADQIREKAKAVVYNPLLPPQD